MSRSSGCFGQPALVAGLAITFVVLFLPLVLHAAFLYWHSCPPPPPSAQEWERYQQLTREHGQEIATAWLQSFDNPKEVRLDSLTIQSYSSLWVLFRVQYSRQCLTKAGWAPVRDYTGDILLVRIPGSWRVAVQRYWTVVEHECR